MAAYCYILFSRQLNKFYVGSTTQSVEDRLKQHRNKFFGNGFTAQVEDWEIFYTISCESHTQALKIEKHLKRMKSKLFLENLKRFPEMAARLKAEIK